MHNLTFTNMNPLGMVVLTFFKFAFVKKKGALVWQHKE